VSATTALGPRTDRRDRPPLGSHPAAQGLVAATIALDVGVLAAGVVAARASFLTSGWDLIAWAVAVAVVGAASLSFESGSQLGLDMPLLLAAGFIFGPIVGGAIAVIAYVDSREFRREVSIRRALFNRAQTSLSVIAAAAAFTAVAGNAESWPSVFLGAVLAVGIDCLINYGVVAGVLALHDRVPYSAALSQLHFGSPIEFAATWAAFGLLSLTLVETYETAGAWALVVFSVPLLLARQALASGRRLDKANRRIVTQSEALRTASATLVDERRDERLALAAGIHDELLPALFEVHLMGQVLRQDLASGQLLALEEDLPELLRATNTASESTRTLIRGLRESPIGSAGLVETLRTLADFFRLESGIRIELQVRSEAHGPQRYQFLVYQVAREAIRNAVRHARPNVIRVSLEGDQKHIGLVVEDDGLGFVPAVVDRNKHFGLELMRERVELAGGLLRVDSTLGTGTRVSIRIPTGSVDRD